MADTLSGSVGEHGDNRPDDVRRVYGLFNTFLPNPLVPDDACSKELAQAIREFQKSFLPHPDARIDVGGSTWKRLLQRAGVAEEKKSVLLTFDDGPAPEDALDSILDTLAAHGIKAEFYALGAEVDKYPAAAQRIVSKGHNIQNHSYTHPDLSRASKETVRSELRRTQESIQRVTGMTPCRIRPPYGAGGWPSHYDRELAGVAAELSLKIENWDIDTEDWKAPKGIGPAKLSMIKRQFDSIARKSRLNVLMHVQQETARDLGAFVAHLKQWGYAFASP